ncbi:MAG TPA: AraC family transcriptional regulator [Chitinophagaceae bacterium]|nr:AraC family transcriptional regulator [Chitinophagaceae bacterium]
MKRSFILPTELPDSSARHFSSGATEGNDKTASGNPDDVTNLLRVQRYLTDHYKEAFPGVLQLSRLSMMSPTKLKSGFRRFFGYTLFDYYQKYRLEQAKMLLQKKLPVKIVAAEFGYSNPSHFSLAFRKEFGIPPSKLDIEPGVPGPSLTGLPGNGGRRDDLVAQPLAAPLNQADIELMRLAEEYILREYCSDTFTVQQLVKQMAVNYNRLNLLFKSKYGMKVSEYIRLKRIEKSREMIAGGDKSISEIAYEIGYSSISNYILAFKKVHQVTPGNYRRQIA